MFVICVQVYNILPALFINLHFDDAQSSQYLWQNIPLQINCTLPAGFSVPVNEASLYEA